MGGRSLGVDHLLDLVSRPVDIGLKVVTNTLKVPLNIFKGSPK